MKLIQRILFSRRLKAWRKKLNAGEAVSVQSGKHSFRGIITNIHSTHVTVMNSELQLSAYGLNCIYPIDNIKSL